jgi:TonB family protein
MKPQRIYPALMVLGVLLFTSGRAQDFTLMPLDWTDPEDPPDELPVIPQLGAPQVSAELKAYDGYAYAMVRMTVLGQDRLASFKVNSTHPDLGADLSSTRITNLVAAKREGKKVTSAVWTALLFNPEKAAVVAEPTAPRLRQVMPVVIDPRPDVAYPEKIVVQLKISRDGKVAEADFPPGTSANVIEEGNRALRHWRFDPAQENGQPKPAAIEMPLLIITHENIDDKRLKKAVPKRRVPPEYPLNQRMGNLEGEAVVEFGIDLEGRVRQPFVVQSTNPGFDAAAINAIRQWTFDPSSLDGCPVFTPRVQQKLSFRIEGGGRPAFTVEHSAKAQKKLPPELRSDVPPKLLNIMPVVYPLAALMEKRRGKIEVLFVVGPHGRVTQVQFNKAEHEDMAAAVEAMLDTLVFSPALRAGQPVSGFLRMELNFDEKHGEVTVEPAARELLAVLRRAERTFPTLAELDKKPEVISRRPPIYPSMVEANEGSALIEFYVDEFGLAQFPILLRRLNRRSGMPHAKPSRHGGFNLHGRTVVRLPCACACR